jgi:hypothetical protein
MARWPDERVREEWLGHLKRMFPDFDDSLITDFIVQRARYVEPLRPLGTLDQIPEIKTPVARLYMGNTALYYPDLGNGDAATRFVTKLADVVLSDEAAWSPHVERVEQVS